MSPSVRLFMAVVATVLSGAGSAQTISTSAKFALLEDYDTGAALFDKASEESMAPASTSKLLVAEMVFREVKEGRLKLDDKFHVSEYAWRTGGAHAHGSAMFLDVKSEVRVEDLLRGLIIQSGNDAAIVLAEGLGGSEDAFVGLMNKRAAELGLAHSHFTNAWGRSDPDERVTARDMAKLAHHIISDYPDFYHYFGEKDFTWNKIHQMNRNPLLTMNLGADGLKTGDTAESGFGLVGSAVQDGQRLILVVNGLKTAAERGEESRKLLNWGFRAFDARTFFQPGDTVGRAQVYGGADGFGGADDRRGDQGLRAEGRNRQVDGQGRLSRSARRADRSRTAARRGQNISQRRFDAARAAEDQDRGARRRPRSPRVRRGAATRRGLAAPGGVRP